MMTKAPRELLTLFAVMLVGLALFATVLGVGNRSIDCWTAARNADCDREVAFRIAGHINGAVFDRINVLAGHVPLIDAAMEFAARYTVFAVAGIAGLSWFVRGSAGRERRLAVYTAMLGAGLALMVTLVIQHVYVHERPFVLRSDVVLLIKHGADPSFPSEHSTVAFALATGIALYRPRFGVVLLVLACLTAFSRVYVGLHYPGDVAGGALIGMFGAFAVWAVRRVLIWFDNGIVLRLLPAQLR